MTTERELFEAWAYLRGWRNFTREGGGYLLADLDMRWIGWQARAAFAQPAQDWANGPLSRDNPLAPPAQPVAWMCSRGFGFWVVVDPPAPSEEGMTVTPLYAAPQPAPQPAPAAQAERELIAAKASLDAVNRDMRNANDAIATARRQREEQRDRATKAGDAALAAARAAQAERSKGEAT